MVKNKKLSKSSVAIIVLALLLVASLVMGMTGAWFTDSITKQSSGLKFGTVKLTVKEASREWTVDTDETGHPYLDATGLMPGDTLNGDFQLQNEGDPAYVFMVYTGMVVKAFDKLTDVQKEAAVTYFNEHKEAGETALVDVEDLNEANTLAYRRSIGEDLIDLLDDYWNDPNLTAGEKQDIVESYYTGETAWASLNADEKAAAVSAFRYATLPADATSMGTWTVDGKPVSYYILERYDNAANVETDEKNLTFNIKLLGGAFGNEYQGDTIELKVEFAAVQVANLTDAQAIRIAFGNRADDGQE